MPQDMAFNYTLLDERSDDTVSDYIKVNYTDIFKQPPSLQIPAIWKIIQIIYRISLKCIYILLSVVVAPFFAIGWGVVFGVYAFLFVWIFNPSYRFLAIIFTVFRSLAYVCFQTFFEPFAYSLGSYWSRVSVRLQPLQPPMAAIQSV